MAKTKVKFNVNSASDMRIRDCFDYLQVHQSDLTVSQLEFVKSLKKQFKERGLTEKQIQCLFDIEKYLKPSDTLRVKVNY